jgi:glycosyltransferase involved in cell wall biosynthesis
MIVIHTTTLNNGGTEREAALLASQFTQWKIPVCLLVDRADANALYPLQQAGIHVVNLQIAADDSALVYSQRLKQTLSNLEVKLMHCHIWERREEVFTVAKELNIKMVVTLHHNVRGTLFHKIGITRTPVLNWRHRELLSAFNPVTITLTNQSQKNFEYVYGRVTRSRCVYPGVELPGKVAVPGSGGQSPVVLWIGSMIMRKDPHLALDVWQEVVKTYPEARLRMIGAGPLLQEIQARAKVFGRQVEILGAQSPWSHFADDAQILLHTARREGLPFVVLEAMAIGLPVVATASGDTAEAVVEGETGFLAKSGDKKGLLKSLKQLIADPSLRSTQGAAGRKRIENRFSLNEHCEAVLSVYQNLAGFEREAFPIAS